MVECNYAECHLCRVPCALSAVNKSFALSVLMLNVIMLNFIKTWLRLIILQFRSVTNLATETYHLKLIKRHIKNYITTTTKSDEFVDSSLKKKNSNIILHGVAQFQCFYRAHDSVMTFRVMTFSICTDQRYNS